MLLVLLLLLGVLHVQGHQGHQHHRKLRQSSKPIAPPHVLFGEDALAQLGLGASGSVASRLTPATARMAAILKRDHEIGYDSTSGRLVAVCEGLAVQDPPANSSSAAAAEGIPLARRHRHLLVTPKPHEDDPPTTDAFTLHSRETATKKIYLDFDGCVVTTPRWNGGAKITNPAYSIDADTTSFSNQELKNIIEIWRHVAEDYAAFNVDVTTEKPAGAPEDYGTWVCIGGNGNWFGSAGGVAYLGIFGQGAGWGQYFPAWVFPGQLGNGYPKYVAEATSHEVGHNLDLSHDGTDVGGQGYYGGHGGWAPIMGVGYNQPLSQWSKGDYLDANNHEDDIEIISGFIPLLQFPNSAKESALDVTSSVGMNQGEATMVTGIITHPAPSRDWFKFTAAASGTVEVSLILVGDDSSYAKRTDLDAKLQVLNSAGTEMDTVDPPGSDLTQLTTTVDVTEGETYFVTVAGVGADDSTLGIGPYPAYGSLGSYAIKIMLTGDPCKARALTCTVDEDCCGDLGCTNGLCGGGCLSGSYLQGASGCRACAVNDGIVPETPTGATSESQCACPLLANATRPAYASGRGCVLCGLGTTGNSTDGQSCTCADGYNTYDNASNSCRPNVCLTADLAPCALNGDCCNNQCIRGQCGGKCPVGSYKHEGACRPCANGGTTEAEGSTSEAQCLCPVASQRKAYVASQGCVSCGVGTWSSNDGRTCPCQSGYYRASQTACTSCKISSTATAYRPSVDEGMSGEASCYCTGSSGTKKLYYKMNFGCTTCAGTTLGSTSSSDGRTCPCKAGYSGFSRTYGTCTACPRNYYATVGQATCTPCQGGGITTAVAQTSEMSCKCPTGQYYVNQFGCAACPAGSRATADGHSCVCPTKNWFDTTADPPACTGCKPKGSSCSAKIECCSNNCKSNKTCQ